MKKIFNYFSFYGQLNRDYLKALSIPYLFITLCFLFLAQNKNDFILLFNYQSYFLMILPIIILSYYNFFFTTQNIEWILLLPYKKLKIFFYHIFLLFIMLIEGIIYGLFFLYALLWTYQFKTGHKINTSIIYLNPFGQGQVLSEHYSFIFIIFITLGLFLFTFHDKKIQYAQLFMTINFNDNWMWTVISLSMRIIIILTLVYFFFLPKFYLHCLITFIIILTYIIHISLTMKIPLKIGKGIIVTVLGSALPMLTIMGIGLTNLSFQRLPDEKLIEEAIYFGKMDDERTLSITKSLISFKNKNNINAFNRLYDYIRENDRKFPGLNALGINLSYFIKFIGKDNLPKYYRYLSSQGKLAYTEDLARLLDYPQVQQLITNLSFDYDDYYLMLKSNYSSAVIFSLEHIHFIDPLRALDYLNSHSKSLTLKELPTIQNIVEASIARSINYEELHSLLTQGTYYQWEQVKAEFQKNSWENTCTDYSDSTLKETIILEKGPKLVYCLHNKLRSLGEKLPIYSYNIQQLKMIKFGPLKKYLGIQVDS